MLLNQDELAADILNLKSLQSYYIKPLNPERKEG
jgi:hypothetical protein